MKKRLAIIGFILSIVGFFIIAFGAASISRSIAILMLIFSNLFFVASIIMGAIVLFKHKEGKAFAIIGIILSILAILAESYMFFVVF